MKAVAACGLAAAVLVLSAFGASPASAQDTYEECIQEAREQGASIPEAIAECRPLATSEANEPTETTMEEEPDEGPVVTIEEMSDEPDTSDEPDASEDPEANVAEIDGSGEGGDKPEDVDTDPAAASDDDETSVALVAAAAGVPALLIGLGVGLLLGRRGRGGSAGAASLPQPVVGGPAPVPPSAGAAAAAAPAAAVAAAASADSRAADQRRLLVSSLIELRDQVPSEGLRTQIAERLLQVGVEEIQVAEGEAFDPNRHRGIDTIPAPDPSRAQRVAHTERPGYLDGDKVLRLPEVVVYRPDGG